MATRLVVFKILFLILIARFSLIESRLHLQSDRTLHAISAHIPPSHVSHDIKVQSNLQPTTNDQHDDIHDNVGISAATPQESASLISQTNSIKTTQSTIKPKNEDADDHQTSTLSSTEIEKTSEIDVNARAYVIQSVFKNESDNEDQRSEVKTINSNHQQDSSLVPKSEKLIHHFEPDELCFLSNGGSSLTLTVNEATPVGSIVGTIEVSVTQRSNESMNERGFIYFLHSFFESSV